MLLDDVEFLNGVRTGQIKSICLVCGSRATIMKRESIPDGFENGTDPITHLPIRYEKFKPGEMKWYCRLHAPGQVLKFIPIGRELR